MCKQITYIKVYNGVRPKAYRIPLFAHRHLGELNQSLVCKSNSFYKDTRKLDMAAHNFVRCVDPRSDQSRRKLLSVEGKQEHMKLETQLNIYHILRN